MRLLDLRRIEDIWNLQIEKIINYLSVIVVKMWCKACRSRINLLSKVAVALRK